MGQGTHRRLLILCLVSSLGDFTYLTGEWSREEDSCAHALPSTGCL